MIDFFPFYNLHLAALVTLTIQTKAAEELELLRLNYLQVYETNVQYELYTKKLKATGTRD